MSYKQGKINKRRVAITGIGAVTSAGLNVQECWSAVLEGMINVKPITIFDASQFPCKFAYEVSGFIFDKDILPQRFQPYLNRAGKFACHCIREALSAANLTKQNIDPWKTAVCLGVGVSSPPLRWYHETFYPQKFYDDELAYYSRRNHPAALSSIASYLVGAKGGNYTIHTACASSGQALGEAYQLIAYGDRDVVLTGGADSMINPFQVAGFCLLGALSTRNDDPQKAARPFDRDRDGFVLGEGACMFIFEEWEHARKRNAKIYGEICGYGVTETAYRITDLHPEGRGTIEAMGTALDDAGIRAANISYINAHGTSTKLNDKIESVAINQVFKNCSDFLVSSTKATTGHLISAAGALEFAVCVLALQQQVIPPSFNLFNKDPDCDIPLAKNYLEHKTFEYALSNSIGFGGSNTSLIARRVEQ